MTAEPGAGFPRFWLTPGSARPPVTRAEVWREIARWRRIWTGNDVRDTAVFFKPVG